MSNFIPILILLSLMLFACSDSIQLTAKQKHGKQIFESLCNKCHRLISPVIHTDSEWIKAVNFYGTKLKLQQIEKDAVIDYLTFVNDK